MRKLMALTLLAGLLVVPVTAQHEMSKEEWIRLRLMFRQKEPLPTIEEDVAALAGPGAKKAGPRLIDRGAEVLPLVHEAYLDPNTPPRHLHVLLQVMGPLGDKNSVHVILQRLREDPDNPIRRDALMYLGRLPATDEASEYVHALASSTDEPWMFRRMAMGWLALHRDPTARPLAESLLKDPEPEKHAAGLFILARLGDESVIEPITRMFDEGVDADLRSSLLLSLAEVATPEEFVRRAPEGLEWSFDFKESLLYARYRAASPGEKRPVCEQMLRSIMPGHQTLAVRCLLESGNAEVLEPHAALDMEAPGRAALIRNEIRKAGWRIIDTEEEFRIVPGS